jgi:predicted DNA-binding protein with PD1-like motif
MSDLKVYSLRLKKGHELTEEFLKFAKDKKLSALFILTCCESVSSTTLRYAKPKSGDKENVEQWKVYFEICLLVGTLAASGHLLTHGHLHTGQLTCHFVF